MIDTAAPRRSRALVVVAIAVLALNLRPAVNAVGSVLPEVRTALKLSATAGGALTSLPPLAFAVFGLVAPVLAGRFRPQRVIVVSLVLLIAGQLLRVLTDSVVLLFAGSLLALAGVAVCNVLLPSLIRSYFPTDIAAMTAVYTTGLAVGATASSALSVPIERGLGGDWHAGIGMWTVVAVFALAPWLAMAFERQPTTVAHKPPAILLRRLLKSRVAWLMGLFFGLQASQAYIVTAWLSQIVVDDGADLKAGGYAVGLFASLGIPISAVIPTLLAKQSRLPWMIIGLGSFYVAGYTGLAIAPAGGMWLWAVLLGVGSGTFPLVLSLIVLRARTAEGVAALSAFAQSVGYLIASFGPLAIGLLHDVTGGWTVPISTLVASAVGLVLVGLQVAGPRVLEDDLARAG